MTDILDGTSPLASKPKAKKPRTDAATKARQKAYDKVARQIVEPLKEIRAEGYDSAEIIAEFLNMKKIPAPSECIWTKSSVLRALRRLRELGLEPKKVQSGYADGPYSRGLDPRKPAHYKLFLQLTEKAKMDRINRLADKIFASL